jgi:predicted HTH domain antitoxin
MKAITVDGDPTRAIVSSDVPFTDGGSKTMSVRVHIPDSVAQAIRLPEDRIDEELRVELAIALYAQRLLSFGKARELAEKGKYEFGRLLEEREVPRHYGPEELEDDIAYARGEYEDG